MDAFKKFDDIISLHFQLELSLFSAVIHINKSVKVKSAP